MKPIIGVDPGASGAASYRNPDGHKVVRFKDKKSYDVVNNLKYIMIDDLFGGTPVLAVENTHAFPKDTPAHAYSFGRNAGRMIGAIESYLRVDPVFVDPKTWQRFFSLGGKYKDTTERKNAHKKVAQKVCPYLKVTLDMADAILIAEYIWRTQGGK